MDYDQVKELIKQLEASNLTELELRLGGDYIRLSKNSSSAAHCVEPKAEPKTETVVEKQPEAHAPVVSAEGTLVRSPLVGTFFASSAPDKPSFIKLGDKVKAGDVLCIVEAMKLMNEITAKTSGTIAEIFPANESMVEYNQPLFRIIES